MVTKCFNGTDTKDLSTKTKCSVLKQSNQEILLSQRHRVNIPLKTIPSLHSQSFFAPAGLLRDFFRPKGTQIAATGSSYMFFIKVSDC